MLGKIEIELFWPTTRPNLVHKENKEKKSPGTPGKWTNYLWGPKSP